jgi:transcriptional regulator with XRE-family HTH domain
VTEEAWRRLADDFAEELSALKAERGVSWEALVAASGVSKTYLLDLASSRGRGLPSSVMVERIAGALDVRPDHFRITRARAIIASAKVIDAVYVKLPKKAAA